MKKPYFFLAAVILAGALLRIYQFTWQCQMVDEQFTASYITNSVSYIVQNSLAADFNPPTYYLCAKLSAFIHGGIDNFSIRLPALIFGILAIPAAYLAGKELKNNTLGILTAIVVAIDYPLIYYSQNARPYSMVLLFFTLFIWMFIRIYTGKDKSNTSIIILGILAAACLWSHYFSAVPLAVAFILLAKKNRHIAISSTIDAGIFILPMALMFGLNQFGERIVKQSTGLEISWYQMITYIPNELFCWMWIVILPLVAYAYHQKKDTAIRPLVWIEVSAPICLVASTFLTGWLMPRYTVLVAPLLIITAMYPIADYLDTLPQTKKLALMLLIIFGLFAMNIMSLYSLWTWSWCPAMHLPIPERGMLWI